MLINFDDARLVKKYGSWARVQVEFYDFIFAHGGKGPIVDQKRDILEQFEETLNGFRDGEPLYETAVKGIEAAFQTAAEAWQHFLDAEGLSS